MHFNSESIYHECEKNWLDTDNYGTTSLNFVSHYFGPLRDLEHFSLPVVHFEKQHEVESFLQTSNKNSISFFQKSHIDAFSDKHDRLQIAADSFHAKCFCFYKEERGLSLWSRHSPGRNKPLLKTDISVDPIEDYFYFERSLKTNEVW